MRKNKTRGLFEEQFRNEKITNLKDPLEQLNRFVRWEDFRPVINKAFAVTDPSHGGRPPFDRVMLFKVLILQRMYNLSDDNTEYQILDRLSFCKFLGIDSYVQVPDAKTIWHYREQLKKHDIIHEIFSLFNDKLQNAALILKDGAIIDASIVQVPKQRNTREENKQVREGIIPEDWKNRPNKLEQKDLDADWTKKNGKTFFGYKNHIKVDNGSKLIRFYAITPASVHDSVMLEDLLEASDEGQPAYADSAYSGKNCDTAIKAAGMDNLTHEKAYRNKPLTKKQKKQNTLKSKIRARVEHVFGYQCVNLNAAQLIRYIGLDRCALAIALRNVIYNFFRAIFIVKTRKLAIVL
jgi:transposase, IS5 family